MQQIRNPDLTLEEMVRMEGSLVHLVEEGEEIVGVEGNSIHLVEGGEEIVRVERNSVHLVEGEEEMVGMDGLAHLVAGGEGEILIKAVEEEEMTGEKENVILQVVTVQYQEIVTLTAQHLKEFESALLSFMTKKKLNSGFKHARKTTLQVPT